MNPAGGNRKHKTKMMQESSDSSADANATITITLKHLNPLVKVFAPSGSSDSCIQDVPHSIHTCKRRAYYNLEPIITWLGRPLVFNSANEKLVESDDERHVN